jgi:hypothetical protein
VHTKAKSGRNEMKGIKIKDKKMQILKAILEYKNGETEMAERINR